MVGAVQLRMTVPVLAFRAETVSTPNGPPVFGGRASTKALPGLKVSRRFSQVFHRCSPVASSVTAEHTPLSVKTGRLEVSVASTVTACGDVTREIGTAVFWSTSQRER